jgi:DNA-binding NtrC family response regulator
VRALRATAGNKSQAARKLKVDYKTLHLKMRKYGLSRGGEGVTEDDDESEGKT